VGVRYDEEDISWGVVVAAHGMTTGVTIVDEISLESVGLLDLDEYL
jgi:hypothetical protein